MGKWDESVNTRMVNPTQHNSPMVCLFYDFLSQFLCVIEVLTEQLGKKGDEGHGHVIEIENIPGGNHLVPIRWPDKTSLSVLRLQKVARRN